MLGILDEPLQPAAHDDLFETQTESADPEEFEIVLGRSQVAIWLFLAVIVVALCSSLAYLAGKSSTPRKSVEAAVARAPFPEPSAAPTSPAMPAASIYVPPKTDLASIMKSAGRPGPPLFAEPENGKVYIQMGAVERGMATILAEGLRSHGFDAFVATGPSEKIFRVLIGPLPDPDSFRQAKAAVDAIDLTTFARKYEKADNVK